MVRVTYRVHEICISLPSGMNVFHLPPQEGEDDVDYNKRVDDARSQIHQRLLLLVHGAIQVGLACLYS